MPSGAEQDDLGEGRTASVGMRMLTSGVLALWSQRGSAASSISRVHVHGFAGQQLELFAAFGTRLSHTGKCSAFPLVWPEEVFQFMIGVFPRFIRAVQTSNPVRIITPEIPAGRIIL